MNHSFDLTREPWIPCAPLDGRPTQEFSIRDVLLKGHDLREIADPSPLVTVSLLRLLLAVLHCCCRPHSLERWKELWNQERFLPGDVDDYLARASSEGCFDLFSELRPFYQSSVLTADELDEVARLRPEATAAGAVSPLFDHTSTKEFKPVSASEAARLLVTTQCYALAGLLRRHVTVIAERQYWLREEKAAIADGLTIWLSGQDLFQTLMLNLVAEQADEDDLPAWESCGAHAFADRPEASNASRPNHAACGILDMLTWQSRLIRLEPPIVQEGRLFATSLHYSHGRNRDTRTHDPMQAYRRESPEAGWKTVMLDREKAAWRDSHAFVNVASDLHVPPRAFNQVSRLVRRKELDPALSTNVNVVGFANDAVHKKAFLWRHDRMLLPPAILAEPYLQELVADALQAAERLSGEIQRRMYVVVKLFLSPDSDKPDGRKADTKDVQALVRALNPHRDYWARLEDRFACFVLRLNEDRDTALQDWRDGVEREAECALREACARLGHCARAMKATAGVTFKFNANQAEVERLRFEAKKRKGGKK